MARNLVPFLKQVKALAAFSDAGLQALADAAEIESYSLNDRVFDQGETGAGLYIVYTGNFRLFQVEDGVEQSICLRGPGELLGEMSAIRELPLEYSVRAAAESELLIIRRPDLQAVLESESDSAKHFLTQFIVISNAGEFLSRFLSLKDDTTREDIERIVNSIGIKKVSEGQVVLEQGGSSDRRLYVVQSGLIRLERQQGDDTFTIGLLGPAAMFGEKACLEHAPQPESAIAARDSVVFVIPTDTMAFIRQRNPGLEHLLCQRLYQREREFERQQKLAQRRKPRVLLDLVTPRGWGNRVLKHFPLVEQEREGDSAAASLAMVCAHYHLDVSLGKLKELVGSSKEADAAARISRAGESLGFTCKELSCTVKTIQTFDLPFIVLWEGYHFVTVYGVSRRHVWLADPVAGFRRLPMAEFKKGWDGTCLTFVPSESIQNPEASSGNPWIRFIRYLVPHRVIVRNIILATMVVELLGLVSPLLTQAVVDKVLVHANLHLLNVLVIGAGVALLFMIITRILRSYLINFLIRKIDFAMMSQFYKHVLAMPVAFFAQRKVGDIMACFNENKKIRQFLTYTAINAVLNVFMFVVYLGVMLTFNVQLSLLFLGFIPVILLLTAYATPRYKDNARQNFFAQARARSILTESLNAAESIKGRGAELPMRMRWEKEYATAVNRQYEAEFFASKIRSLSRFLSGALLLSILWLGARLVISNQLSVGQLMAFTQLVASVMIPFLALIDSWGQLHEAGVSIERLGEILDLPAEQAPEGLPSRVVLGHFTGAMRFENVSFRYGKSDSPLILRNLNFELRPGKRYGVIGSSGSGKTTLCKLLVGLLPPSEGAIFVDGFDLINLDLTSFRAQVGYALQNDTLFSGTLSENITFGDRSPDYNRMVQVARMADLETTAQSSPLGYELMLGERGSGMSDGQQQRLCLARAVYHSPRLLVLDEATSAIDQETEDKIFDNLSPELETCSTVMVPSRPSLLPKCDLIFVLYEGTIAEIGSHDELLARKGIYHRLVGREFKY